MVHGNMGKSAGDSEAGKSISTPSANTNPYNLTTSAPIYLRKPTSLTITASARDNEQTTLYYDLYWNGSSKVMETQESTNGFSVTFTTIRELTEATRYTWRVVVRDGGGGILKGSTQICYTNCSRYGSIM